MNNDLQTAINHGELILFLGAGASRGCTLRGGKGVLDGSQLASYLAAAANYPYEDEPLDEVYGAVRGKLQSRLDDILESLFLNTEPSQDYLDLAEYAWRRVYTLNIDDAFETALRKNSKQKVRIRMASDAIVDQDNFFERLDLVKLNGSIDRMNEGVIFSASEYAKATAKALPWYEQCASDFLRLPILFIGTKLSEPLLKFHIERYKNITGKSPGKSFVITPSATDLQKQVLLDYNIEHISGTLGTFVQWLKSTFPRPTHPLQLAMASIPQLAELLKVPDVKKYATLFDHVTPIKKSTLATRAPNAGYAIREFYKGFRPTWEDIIGDIPAELDVFSLAIKAVEQKFAANSLLPIVGPAGSGKTTLLMQLCYSLHARHGHEVFYINQPIDYLLDTLEAIERTSTAQKIFVALDNFDFVSDQLQDIFSSNRLRRTMLLGTERENIWKRKTRSKIGTHCAAPIKVDEFSYNDAEKILEKLERYGSWTRLGQLTKAQRVKELVDRAQKQLLIALLEATFGLGYGQIIANDFKTLQTDEERLCLLIVGLITDRKQDAPSALIDRAFSSIGILNGEVILSSNLAGMVVQRADAYSVRHPVYVRYILDHLIDPTFTYKALGALLDAFSQYESPVIKNVKKLEGTIYKGLINHAFLKDVLKGHQQLVLGLYKSLEKKFELDGLFWLQYGLALRDYREHAEALEKLSTARQAYPMEHTLHALAQQLLIVAEESNDTQVALTYADQAREILEDLDKRIDSDDTFPIVTLAEGYTRVMRRHRDDASARKIANSFVPRLKSRSEGLADDERLKKAYTHLFKYVATGTWTEPDIEWMD